MQTLREDYLKQRAPNDLQTRLLDDYEQAQRRDTSWSMPAAAFAILLLGVSAVWLNQPSVLPTPEQASETQALKLSAAAAGLPGLTAQTGRFSRLSLSEISTPTAGELSSLPTVPGSPPRPSS